jgi:hypothetical protein
VTPHSTATSHFRRLVSDHSNSMHDMSFTSLLDEQKVPDIIPGLLDFGMTVR